MPVTSITYFTAAGQPSFTSTAATVGPIEWMMPFDGQTSKVMFRQRYQQDIDSWTASTLDAVRVEGGVTYLLSREADHSPIGGGQHQWYRYYATTPPNRTEYMSYATIFPGFIGGLREPYSSVVPAKINYEYFYVATTPPALANEARVLNAEGYSTQLLSNAYLGDTTSPSASAYIVLMSAGTFSITAEQQSLERWVGNFYERKTIYVPAK
jgi:hypothetical protein